MLNCSNCGRPADEGDRFCSNCATALPTATLQSFESDVPADEATGSAPSGLPEQAQHVTQEILDICDKVIERCNDIEAALRNG